jgi:hypothetical protein
MESHDSYLLQRPDAAGMLGLSAIQKDTAAIQQLAYGSPVDTVDEDVHVGERTAIESLQQFCKAIISVFGAE